jgi:hypothetical protein
MGFMELDVFAAPEDGPVNGQVTLATFWGYDKRIHAQVSRARILLLESLPLTLNIRL